MADHKDLKAATGISHSISGSWRKILFGGLCLLLLLALSALAQTIPLTGYKSGDSTWLLEPILSKTAAAWQAEVPALEPGKAVEGELAGGESHSYRLALTSGQYLRVVLNQLNIDVIVRLLAPDGKQLIERNNPGGKQEPERLLFVARVAGEYRIEVRSAEKENARGRYEIKIEELRQATAEDEQRVAAEILLADGEQLQAEGRADSLRGAVKKYEQALPIFRAVGERSRESTVLARLSYIHFNLGELKKALEYDELALPLQRAMNDRRGEAQTLFNLGRLHDIFGDRQKAQGYYNHSLQIRQAEGDRRGEAETLNGIAITHSRVGEWQKAQEYYGRALEIRRALGDRAGAGQILNNLGVDSYYAGEPQQALEYYRQALQIQQALGNRRSEAVTHVNLGTIYLDLGELQQAEEALRQGLELSRTIGYRQMEASALSNLGELHYDRGELQPALEYFNQALQIRREMGDRQKEALTLFNLGRVHASQGRNQQALDYYSQARILQQKVSDLQGEAQTLNEMGLTYLLLGEQQKGLDAHRQALALSQAAGNRSLEAKSLLGIAQVERKRGALTEARTQIERALSIIETVRAKVASQELRTAFLASNRHYYELYIDLLMQQHRAQPAAGYNATALQVSERARARSLLDLLTEARLEIRQGVSPELLAKERALQQQLNAKETYRLRLLSGKPTEEQKATVEKELRDILARVQEVREQIRISSPQYAALTQSQSLSAKEIQQEVLDEETLLLEYALGEQHSFLWAVTPTSIASFELPGRAEIETAAQRLYEILTARNQRPPGETAQQRRIRVAHADAEYPKVAHQLSQMLLGPVAAELHSKRLLIVSEGALQYLPFGALPVPKPEIARASFIPLIAEREVVALPSASALSVLRRALAGRQPAEKAVAVLADPVFTSSDPRLASSQAKAAKKRQEQTLDPDSSPSAGGDIERAAREIGLDSFQRLRFSRQEADEIVALAPGAKTLKAVDFAANRATATSMDLSRYRVVHFATHGLLNNQHPELSGIVLSLVDEQGRAQDGFLRLHEIYNLKLGADLVVLSACQTALGKGIKGEGLIGLTRGFMYAGAPRVIASLWNVQDRATAELMKRFYQGMLRDGLRPAAALRAAQLQMWQQPRWQLPYYWASFVLQGEWK
jgi:CHAT domain-containing protein/Tfp pilus assembly protein PilF